MLFLNAVEQMEFNFFVDKVDPTLTGTQKLCNAVQKMKDERYIGNNFYEEVNKLFSSLKKMTKHANKKDTKALNIKFKKELKKKCCLELLSLYKHGDFNVEKIYSDILFHFKGEEIELEKDYSDLRDDLELYFFQQQINDSETVLNIPYCTSSLNSNQLVSKSEKMKANFKKFLKSFFPPLTWFPQYAQGWKKNLISDLVAGLTTGIMVYKIKKKQNLFNISL